VVLQKLDFKFPFFGKNYDTVVLNTDGSIIFYNRFEFLRTETALKSNKMIAVFATDLMIYPELGDEIFYTGDETKAEFRWKTSLFENPDAQIDVSITLFPSGKINFDYGQISVPEIRWIAGISDGDNANWFISPTSNTTDIQNKQIIFEETDFPVGISINKQGLLYGTPVETGKSRQINIAVTDFNNITKTKILKFDSYPANVKNEGEVICYPIPFQEEFRISFISPKQQTGNLKIYDTAGRLILNKTQNFEQGINTIEIFVNEKNNYAGKLFFYRLEIGNTVYKDKILYLK